MRVGVPAKPPGRARRRPFGKGRSGNPTGRQPGSRNKATLVAAVLLEGEAEALTRKAVELALAGDPTAMRLCLDRVLPRERFIEFSLPPLAAARAGEAGGPSPNDLFQAMNAVMGALARGEITPGEAERVAAVVDTFAGAIETSNRAGSRINLLQILTADSGDEDDLEEGSAGGDDAETDDDWGAVDGDS
jgi:hypothetical protein